MGRIEAIEAHGEGDHQKQALTSFWYSYVALLLSYYSLVLHHLRLSHVPCSFNMYAWYRNTLKQLKIASDDSFVQYSGMN